MSEPIEPQTEEPVTVPEETSTEESDEVYQPKIDDNVIWKTKTHGELPGRVQTISPNGEAFSVKLASRKKLPGIPSDRIVFATRRQLSRA